MVAVFGSSATEPGSNAWEEAETVGRLLAEAGFGVVTGGYGGSMEAVSKGVAERNGQVVGITAPALFPERTAANPHVGLLIEAESLLERIGAMFDRACGVIALPGSIGTATELAIAWNLNHIARHNDAGRLPTAAVGQGWRTYTNSWSGGWEPSRTMSSRSALARRP
ncbi:MAG: LOG family protein [Actinobacteria bacterium]|nr:LOG family protein [Actinomycetota bacterium]